MTVLNESLQFQIMGKKNVDRQESAAKVVIYSRIDPTTVAALDEICESMRPKPTRSQLIDAALAEFVERRGKKANRRKGNE